MFSALKNENDKLKSWRLSHAGNDMDVSGRSHGVGGFTPHPTAVRSLHHGAAAPDHLMPNSLMRGSSSLGQHHVPPPAPPGRISDRQFSPGDGLGGRPSSAFGLRGSQQVSPAAGIPSSIVSILCPVLSLISAHWPSNLNLQPGNPVASCAVG